MCTAYEPTDMQSYRPSSLCCFASLWLRSKLLRPQPLSLLANRNSIAASLCCSIVSQSNRPIAFQLLRFRFASQLSAQKLTVDQSWASRAARSSLGLFASSEPSLRYSQAPLCKQSSARFILILSVRPSGSLSSSLLASLVAMS